MSKYDFAISLCYKYKQQFKWLPEAHTYMIQLGLSYQKIFGWFPNTNNSIYVLKFISKFYIISLGKYFVSILEILKEYEMLIESWTGLLIVALS